MPNKDQHGYLPIEEQLQQQIKELQSRNDELYRQLHNLRLASNQLNVQLEQSHRHWTDLLEATLDYAFTMTIDGNILNYNRAARELLDIPSDADLSCWTIYKIHPQWAADLILKEGIPTALQLGKWSGKTAVLRSDGKEIPTSQLIVTKRNPDGTVAILSTLLRDISSSEPQEKALRESERQYRLAVDHLPYSFVIYDSQLRIRFINDYGVELCGKNREAVIAHRDEDLFPFEITQTYLPALNRALELKERQQVERTISLAGKSYTVIIDYVPILNKEGNVEQILGITSDISERKRAEDALQFLVGTNIDLNIMLDYQAIIEQTTRLAIPFLGDLCIIIFTESSQYNVTSVAHVNLLKEKLAREIRYLYPVNKHIIPLYKPVLGEGRYVLLPEITEENLQHISPDTMYHSLLTQIGIKSIMVVPLISRGRIMGLMTLGITESQRRYESRDLSVANAYARRVALAIDNSLLCKEAQERQTAAEHSAFLTSSLQSITDALAKALTIKQVAEVVADESVRLLNAVEGAFLTINKDTNELELIHGSGYSSYILTNWRRVPLSANIPTAETARTGKAIFLESEADWDLNYPEVSSINSSSGFGAAAILPLQVKGCTIGIMGLSFNCFRIFSPEDKQCMYSFAMQVAQALERARLYEAEQRARTEAQEANAVKDQFVAMISHELRNPLAAVRAGLEVLRRQIPNSGPASRALEIVERNARLQTRLVNDLLDLSRIARGKLHLQRAPVLLESVVRSAEEAYLQESIEAGLTFSIETSVAGLWVHGDWDRLQQVVANLLTNAIKFTPRGGRIVVKLVKSETTTASAAPLKDAKHFIKGFTSGTDQGFARIIVEDTGVGIDKNALDHLFGMFQQGDVSGWRGPGLGIGLALVKGITERHGGRVWAESEGPGKGSRFIVELPLIVEPLAMVTQETRVSGRQQISLLLVEDNPETRSMLADSLVLMGYNVSVAGSGEEGLEILHEIHPHIILADIGLPGINGYEFLKRARELPQIESVLAFAVTGYGQEEDVRRGREAGFAGHFVKPVDLARLDRQIREQLGM